MNLLAGIIFLPLGILYWAIKLYVVFDVSKDPCGGGGVPTLDGCLFPPIFVTMGLSYLAESVDIFRFPDWVYIFIWISLTVGTWLLYELIYRLNRSARDLNLEKLKNLQKEREEEHKD